MRINTQKTKADNNSQDYFKNSFTHLFYNRKLTHFLQVVKVLVCALICLTRYPEIAYYSFVDKNYFMKKGIPYKIAVLVVLIIALAASFYFYVQYQNARKLLQNPTLVASEETKVLIAKVYTLIELPSGESPTIATVTDKSKLTDQPFFAKAQNGDKLLVYEKAGELILYRPSINKIIQVVPVNSNAVSSAPAQMKISTTPAPTSIPISSPTLTPKVISVAIYNGTKINGLASTTGDQLTTKIAGLNVVKKADATGNYTGTLVIDLTGNNSAVVKQIAADLNGKIGTLPANEVKPDADILVIVGK